MNLKELHQLGVKLGMKADLRGEAKVKKLLARKNKMYNDLPKSKQEKFDKTFLTNPYPDSLILNDTGKALKKIFVGIDIDVGDLLLARDLGADTVISHHPHGKGLLYLDSVMELQVDVLAHYGVPINIAQSLLKPRMSEVARSVRSRNMHRVADAAKLLNLNFVCLHTVCDNLVARYLYDLVEKNKKKLEYVSDVLELFAAVPEYRIGEDEYGFKLQLFAGSKQNYCGRVALTEITGGTEGSEKIYQYCAMAGIGTIVGMHMSEKHRDAAQAANVNSIIAEHMPSDSVGVNLFLDEVKKADKKLEIIPASGLIYYSRLKNKK
ncbi:MAG TPA: NGG1p interacting factor NIF3 [bacterium]|nr:NGG1p interacting factor NIF3 [bacterium]